MNPVVYPAIFEQTNEGYFVSVPDLNINTQGKDFGEAIEMARDAIALWLMELEDSGQKVPVPEVKAVIASENAIVSYVDVDVEAYRRKYGSQAVKKNCTIPAWLATKAEANNINFSQVLQEALIAKIQQLEAQSFAYNVPEMDNTFVAEEITQYSSRLKKFSKKS